MFPFLFRVKQDLFLVFPLSLLSQLVISQTFPECLSAKFRIKLLAKEKQNNPSSTIKHTSAVILNLTSVDGI